MAEACRVEQELAVAARRADVTDEDPAVMDEEDPMAAAHRADEERAAAACLTKEQEPAAQILMKAQRCQRPSTLTGVTSSAERKRTLNHGKIWR
jgi:hypothetical protein